MSDTSSFIGQCAAEYGDNVLVEGPDSRLTFAEADIVAGGLAEALGKAGLEPGDRVAVLSLPSARMVALFLGCFEQGLVVCPINTRLPRHGVSEAIFNAGCKAVIVDDYFEASQLGHVHALRIDDLFSAAKSSLRACRRPASAEPALAVFTSGSTHEPRAALLSTENLIANATASNQNLKVAPGNRWLLSLPLYHVSGLGILFRCLLGGGTIVTTESGERAHEVIAKYRATHASLVATQLFHLIEDGKARWGLAMLKSVLLGGSSIPPQLIDRTIELEIPIYTTYGLTEMASQVLSLIHI